MKNFLSFILSFITSGYGNATRVVPCLAGNSNPYVKGTCGFIFSLLLFVNYSFAEVAVQDPDLNLSIEKLRKKYPIGWLEEKYGNYSKFCVNYGYCDCDSGDCSKVCQIPKKPKNLVCIFYYDQRDLESNREGFEDAKMVSLTSFTESEIKSILVNYSDYENDSRIRDIIGILIDYFANKKSKTLNQFDARVLKFAFAPTIANSYAIGCGKAKSYFDLECEPMSVTKNSSEKLKIRFETQEQTIKQKFQKLFFSKL